MTDVAVAPAPVVPTPSPAATSSPPAGASAVPPAASSEAPLGNLIAESKAVEKVADTQAEKPLAETNTDKDNKDAVKPPLFPNLKLPEGMKADDALLTNFTKDAAEYGISADQVQKLVDKYGGKLVPLEVIQQQLDAPNQLWKDTQKQWQDAVKSDPEVGGSNLATNLASIAKVIDSIGGKESAKIREAFNFTGAGNNPEIVRFLHRLASNLNVEGRTVPAGGPANVSFSTAAQKIYPKE